MPTAEHIRKLVYHQPKPEPARRLRIGLVGAGNITRTHLNGYKWAGLEAAAIYDLSADKARERAEAFGIPRAAESLDDLLSGDDVEVIDLNFPGNARLDAIRAIADAGKPVLVQKPLADDHAVARQMVEVCESAGVPLAVNMNARWGPHYRTAKQIVDSGVLGEVYMVVHHLSSNHDGMPHHAPWLTRPERYQIVQYGVHHIDQVCWWMGRTPRAVTATNTRKPDQHFNGEMLPTISMDFGDTVGATLLDYNALHAKRPYATTFEINGTRGALLADIWGAMSLYHDDLGDEPLELEPNGAWFPNAFGCVMADLMDAVAGGREPEVSGRANLAVLATIEGCYRSMHERRTVDAEDFLTEETK